MELKSCFYYSVDNITEIVFILSALIPAILMQSLACQNTTLLENRDITDLEDRLFNLEKSNKDKDQRLRTLEKALGQLLTGKNDSNLANLNVLKLRNGGILQNVSPVIFSAFKYSSVGGISTGVIIKFEYTYINLGNHYHTADGIFLVPTTGIYAFHWNIVTGGKAFTTQLMVDGSVKASSYIPYPGGPASGAAMIIINVRKGDHVWIQTYGSSNHVYGGSGTGSKQSTFSGILLRET